jgi:uncharacterized membrane protein
MTPWVLQGSTLTSLPAPKGAAITEANGINGSGVVVGDAEPANASTQTAIEWVNGKESSLGRFDGTTWAAAEAVNSSGVAVGFAAPAGSPDFLTDAIMFSNGKAINLNAPGAFGAQATAINDSGVIVGELGSNSSLLGSDGFIFKNGQSTDLNDLIAPTSNVVLAAASGINNAGDIVGTAAVIAPDGTTSSVGYELLPITTP